jgi:hypothetical protein
LLKNPENGRLNNLNDPVLSVLKIYMVHMVKSHRLYSRRLMQFYGQVLSNLAINLKFHKRAKIYLLAGQISESKNFYRRSNLDAFADRDCMLHNEMHRLCHYVLDFSTQYIIANRDVFFACHLITKCLDQPE